MVKNKKLEIILKVFLSNLYKFLCKLHDEEMIVFLLKLLPNISELIIINVFIFLFPSKNNFFLENSQGKIHKIFYWTLVNQWVNNSKIEFFHFIEKNCHSFSRGVGAHFKSVVLTNIFIFITIFLRKHMPHLWKIQRIWTGELTKP